MSQWEAFADEMYGGTRVPRVPGITRYLYEQLGLRPESLVYDLGAGRGHVAIELGLRGCSIRAVDLVPSFAAGLRSAADHLRLPIATILADVQQLDTRADACAVLLLWNVVGAGEGHADPRILAQARKLVHEGGSLAVELTTIEDLNGERTRTRTRPLADGATFLRSWTLHLSPAVQRVEWTVRARNGIVLRHTRFLRRVYTRAETCALLRSAGWSVVSAEHSGSRIKDFLPTGTMFLAVATNLPGQGSARRCCAPPNHVNT
jgi:cyclopropane fatty-acyl-phospholipid synthase-like methyltransferase